MQVSVKGSEDLDRLARALRSASGSALRQHVRDAIEDALRPLEADLRASALATLPSGGGYASLIAQARAQARATIAGSTVSVSLELESELNLEAADRGTLRHPLFGNRAHWFSQQVAPDWFTQPVRDLEPSIERSVLDALERVAQQYLNH